MGFDRLAERANGTERSDVNPGALCRAAFGYVSQGYVFKTVFKTVFNPHGR